MSPYPLLKDHPFTELTSAIHTVAAGGSYFSPGLSLTGIGSPAEPEADSQAPPS